MQTWKLPDPPGPDIDVIEDGTGRSYYRVGDAGDYWVSTERGNGRGTFAWADLLLQRGEVREVRPDGK